MLMPSQNAKLHIFFFFFLNGRYFYKLQMFILYNAKTIKKKKQKNKKTNKHKATYYNILNILRYFLF